MTVQSARTLANFSTRAQGQSGRNPSLTDLIWTEFNLYSKFCDAVAFLAACHATSKSIKSFFCAKKVPTNMDSRYVKLGMLYFYQAMKFLINITFSHLMAQMIPSNAFHTILECAVRDGSQMSQRRMRVSLVLDSSAGWTKSPLAFLGGCEPIASKLSRGFTEPFAQRLSLKTPACFPFDLLLRRICFFPRR